jgi:chemotaxis protein methyltransferase CheR
MADQMAIEKEKREIQTILEVLLERTGYDFQVYSDTFIRRRLEALIRLEGLASFEQLRENILFDNLLLHRLVQAIPVFTTSMFRDPEFFRQFRELVIPMLRTYPYLRIWHAGCSTGEEAYSMAILLMEEGLYERTKIYATDLHEPLLSKAKAGMYSLHTMQANESNYILAGGKSELSKYYTADNRHFVLHADLRKNIVFAQHNLTTDGVFNEFNVVFCRNVFFYFNHIFQKRVHTLLYESLNVLGILALGNNESIRGTDYAQHYIALDPITRMYQKIK